jgi:hypothetical protein
MLIKKLQNHLELVTNVLKKQIEQPQDIGLVMLVVTQNNWDYHPQILGNGNSQN